jgi:hypothetical protein
MLHILKTFGKNLLLTFIAMAISCSIFAVFYLIDFGALIHLVTSPGGIVAIVFIAASIYAGCCTWYDISTENRDKE